MHFDIIYILDRKISWREFQTDLGTVRVTTTHLAKIAIEALLYVEGYKREEEALDTCPASCRLQIKCIHQRNHSSAPRSSPEPDKLGRCPLNVSTTSVKLTTVLITITILT